MSLQRSKPHATEDVLLIWSTVFIFTGYSFYAPKIPSNITEEHTQNISQASNGFSSELIVESDSMLQGLTKSLGLSCPGSKSSWNLLLT